MAATLDDIKNDLDRIELELGELLTRITVSGAQVNVTDLSQISQNLGLAIAGEFRAGKGIPGRGFTGVRMAYPAFKYSDWSGAESEWHIAGVNNDELQFGLSAVDGKAYAGGGSVVIDSEGINLLTNNIIADTVSIDFYNLYLSAGYLIAKTYASSATGPSGIRAFGDKLYKTDGTTMASEFMMEYGGLLSGARTTFRVIKNSDSSYTVLQLDGTTESLYLSRGSFGIGTSVPLDMIHLEAAITDVSIMLANTTATTGKTWVMQSYSDGSFRLEHSGVINAMHVLPTTGFVGFGTNSPRNRVAITIDTAETSPPAIGLATGSPFSILAKAGYEPGRYGLLAGVLSTGNGYLSAQRTDGSATVYSLSLQANGGNVGIGLTTPSISDSNARSLHIAGTTLRLAASRSIATTTTAGNVGEICWDTDYIYVRVSTTNWKRVAIATW